MSITRAHLRGVRRLEDVVNILGQLGFAAAASPLVAGDVGIPNLEHCRLLRRGSRRREGYGVLVGEIDRLPRSLLPVAKAARNAVHDRPLLLVGVRTDPHHLSRLLVVRPRIGGRGLTLAKLDVDLDHPTQHDARVLSELAWDASATDKANQDRVDRALDVDEVTNRFYRGLRQHYDALRESIRRAMDDDYILANAVKALGGEPAERAALRILTQVLFVQFLQRKGFLEGTFDWMSRAFRTKSGPYYESVLEPLLYDSLGAPRDLRSRRAVDAPFLNGGLFERFYGDASLALPDEIFDVDEGLLGYLDQWTFTITEDMPDEAEVAVDPEMLGKIFEHLSGEESVDKHGTVYTPRPVVHFMCREALVSILVDRLSLTEAQTRTLLTDPTPFAEESLGQSMTVTDRDRLAERLPVMLDDLRVLDPAVGSGAFPLGVLAEIVRLKTLAHAHRTGSDPPVDEVYGWKQHAIQHVLFGVDIEPRAIELCRLRYWLSLLVDLPSDVEPHPLPNLEYRTVVANSLVDFVGGVEIQNTRGGLSYFDNPDLADLHDEWFTATGDAKDRLGALIQRHESNEVDALLQGARDSVREQHRRDPDALAAELARVDQISERFTSRDREFPCFAPALHAPEIASRGGWDIVIMNPPYVGRKEIPKRLTAAEVADLERHFGDTNDLMILFAERALEFVRPGGVVSMIFNDSITSSVDANQLRRRWTSSSTIRTLARTKCFEGRAINGGVVVVRNQSPTDVEMVTWVEGYRKNVHDFSDASDPRHLRDAHRGKFSAAGELEVWRTPLDDLLVLPHRPQFRPSSAALTLLDHYRTVKDWSTPDGWSSWDARSRKGWTLLSNTRGLANHIAELQRTGWFDRLRPDDWTLLGLVIEGGQGLATADDRRFLAAVDGTTEADEVRARQADFGQRVREHPEAVALFDRVHRSAGTEAALLAVWDAYGTALNWPRIGLIRIAGAADVRTSPLSETERREGIARGPYFVPFEKGDTSDEGDSGQALGARWIRENPIVIDWSAPAVELLRSRAGRRGRSPRIQNEHNWFREGVTWNNVTSYLRARLVPPTSLFGHKAPTVWPTVPWLTTQALLALLNSDTIDFLMRTFLSSRMQMEVGDARRVVVPVLDAGQSNRLDALGRAAVEAKLNQATERLSEIEAEINAFVRGLYRLRPSDDLWVVR
jgi:hypothetical protein